MQNLTTKTVTIKVKEKNNYGTTLYYVVDESQRDALYYLTKGQKTLTYTQCVALIELGFHIEIIQDNPFTK